jgi:hypothetical protein
MGREVKMSSNGVTEPSAAAANTGPAAAQLDDAVYQKNERVARTLEVQVDSEAKEIRFGELYESDRLVLPDECEYQRYRILIRRVAFATRLDRSAANKGRVLRGVVAEILGYRE